MHFYYFRWYRKFESLSTGISLRNHKKIKNDQNVITQFWLNLPKRTLTLILNYGGKNLDLGQSKISFRMVPPSSLTFVKIESLKLLPNKKLLSQTGDTMKKIHPVCD